MYYYKYDNRGYIIEKSNEVLTGDNVCYCNLDFDLNLYEVVVGYVSETGEILRHTKIIRNTDAIVQKIEAVEKQLKPTIDYDACTLEELKDWQVNQSKKNLEIHLKNNPLFSTCHKSEGGYYSITQEKQNLLLAAISIAQMKADDGIDYQPSWNETGKACTYDWTIDQLKRLSYEIAEYVTPLVSKQQEMEEKINLCSTKEEVLAINIEF